MKNTTNIRSAVVALALGASALAPAVAQKIYRCGDSYGNSPCAQGRLLDTVDTRISSDPHAAKRASQRDAALAESMERARLKEEAKPANAYIPVAAGTRDADSARDGKPVMTRGLKPHTFTAVAPGEKQQKQSKGKRPTQPQTPNKVQKTGKSPT
jgi:hypothetical protein